MYGLHQKTFFEDPNSVTLTSSIATRLIDFKGQSGNNTHIKFWAKRFNGSKCYLIVILIAQIFLQNQNSLH